MTENINDAALAAELMLRESGAEEAPESLEELFLHYLVMEFFVKMMRERGLSNKEILQLCRRIDQDEQHREESSQTDHGPEGRS